MKLKSRKIIYCIIFLSNLNPCFSQDFGLPRYMTEEEKKIGNDYVSMPPVNAFPPPNPVRTMAEWEELDGIVLTWTSYQFLLRQIVDAAQEEGMVWIICSDSNSVKSYLQGGGIPLYNIAFFQTSFNSVWSRDYGPWCVYTLQGDTLGFVDFKYNRPRPLDDVIPVYLSNRWTLPIYQTISGQDSLAHPGGNFMVDGFGTGFASKLIEMENSWHTPAHIDSILFRYCGIQIGKMVRMTVLPYDCIHHIDMHMKLLDEETLLISQYPTGISNGPQIEANIQFIQNNYLNCYGRPYKIVRIPAPPSLNGQYPQVPCDNQNYLFTYTNSTFINKTILVPLYNRPQLDSVALSIYRENLPGYTVIGYDCNTIIPAGGAIHCINKEIGTRNPVLIAHARLQNTNDTINNYPVLANIKNRYGIDSALVYWTTDTSLGYNRAVMTNSGGQNWTGSIPNQSAGRIVYYYIKARTNNGKYFSKPITAPRGHWKFNILGPTGISINGNTIPNQYRLYQNYPNPFNPITNIKFDIPSNLKAGVKGQTSNVKLTVYDILGREIAVLVNERLKPGSYKYYWNASKLTSGAYFYKLDTGNYRDVKKMIYIK